jgi:hypothetical protein
MSLKPNLASHAPNVNRIILTVVIGILEMVRDRGIIATKVSIMPSKENNDIRKC